MKIGIIGAGNVGGLTALRLAEEGFWDIVLIDKVSGLAKAKALDLEDARAILKYNYHIQGSDDIKDIKDSDIIIVTAGLTRRADMRREDLLSKNAEILKDVSLNIKRFSPQSIIIVVSNPVDLMTLLVLKITGFKHQKVFGMGISLDTSRFSNLISKELNIPITDIEAMVIGSHTEGMLPLVRFTHIKDVALDEFLDHEKIEVLIKKTVTRAREIISLLDNGSAFFAPASAIAAIVKIIAKDEKQSVGVSAYLNGEYGSKDICMGVPCRLGKQGIEKIIELDLEEKEKEAFLKSANLLKEQFNHLII